VTTHTYEDRVRTVEIMKANHISPCSGVICRNIVIILKHFIGDNKSSPPNFVPLIGCKKLIGIPISLKAANSIFVGDYLITGGQPNELDYQMIEDLGFEIDG
jgi:biotin synthase